MIIYLIDAFNIIHKIECIRNSSTPHVDFIHYLKTLKIRKNRQNKIVIVFDGYPNAGVITECQYKIVFSKEKTADDIIKTMIDREKKKGQVVVVSDDREILNFARISGITIKSIKEFLQPTISKDSKEPIDDKQLSESTKEKITRELESLWVKN